MTKLTTPQAESTGRSQDLIVPEAKVMLFTAIKEDMLQDKILDPWRQAKIEWLCEVKVEAWLQNLI